MDGICWSNVKRRKCRTLVDEFLQSVRQILRDDIYRFWLKQKMNETIFNIFFAFRPTRMDMIYSEVQLSIVKKAQRHPCHHKVG